MHQALEAVNATGYANGPVGRLSGGEQQRLLLAQALVARLRLLLLDEPLASTGAVLVTVATAAATLLILTAIYRPLLFSSLDAEVAEARGVRVGALGVGFMLLMALAVSEAVQVSGALLIFALLIAPGAIVERLIRRPFRALMAAAAIAVLITWASLALAYYTSYPVSFYVTGLAFVLYLLARAIEALRAKTRTAHEESVPVLVA